jgi:putative tryptophan/tyrosine transport system substrate-binding protein
MAAEHRRLPVSRRQFVQGAGVASLGLLAGCGRLPEQASRLKTPHVGYLSPFSADNDIANDASFRAGLQNLGYSEGETLTIDRRYAEGKSERLPELAAELVRIPVDVLVVFGSPSAHAAKAVTTTIPIVLAIVADPVGTGLVTSIAHPGGNITGLTSFSPELGAKRLELLKAVEPNALQVALLWNATDPDKLGEYRATEAAATVLGLQVRSLEVRDPGDIAPVLSAASSERADVFTALANPVTISQRKPIVDVVNRNRQPSIYNDRAWVQDGGLMSYGANPFAVIGRAAYYVDRILKGTKPADLPVEQPAVFDFFINLQTAQALGLTIPQHVLLQATEVIQ